MSGAGLQRHAPVPSAPPRRARTEVVAAWAPVLAWMALILSLSGDRFGDVNTASWLARLVGTLGLSPALIAAANFIVRKAAHFVEYAILALLIVRAARITWPGLDRRRLAAGAFLAAAAWAGVDELRQLTFTATRSGHAADVLLDSAGALFGALLWMRSSPRRARAA